MTTPRHGVVLQPVDVPGEFTGLVDRIEELGYDNLWLTDSSLHARDVYSYLTLAAGRTSRLQLGTAVTNPLTRHPGVTAVAAATIDELSGGRMILGMGAGDRPLEAFGLRPAKVARVESAITVIRSILAGGTVTGEIGPFELVDPHLRFEARPDLPVFMSASGPRMLELAGKVTDGVIMLVGLFDEGLRFAIEQIERGAAEAGRPRPHLAVFAYGAVSDDEDEALEKARTIAAWFPQTAPAYCRLAGLDDELVEAVRSRYSGGEFQEAAEAAKALPPEFVRKVALAGNVDRTAETIKGVLATGVDSVHVFPLGSDRLGTIERFAEAWSAAVGESG